MTSRKYTNRFVVGLGIIGSLGMAMYPLGSIAAKTQTISLQTTNSKAKEILDKVHSSYQSKNYLKVGFTTSYADSKSGRTATQQTQGTLLLAQKQNQYRITSSQQDYISDGQSQWIVLKDVKEVQITEVSDQAGQISPATMFSFFQTGFDQKLIESQMDSGKQLWLIELTPQKKNQAYQKISVRIDKSNHQIFDIQIFDKNQGKMTYKIQGVQNLASIDPIQFKFVANDYTGYEIVDLR